MTAEDEKLAKIIDTIYLEAINHIMKRLANEVENDDFLLAFGSISTCILASCLVNAMNVSGENINEISKIFFDDVLSKVKNYNQSTKISLRQLRKDNQ